MLRYPGDVVCPTCGAIPGRVCFALAGPLRKPHRQRIFAFRREREGVGGSPVKALPTRTAIGPTARSAVAIRSSGYCEANSPVCPLQPHSGVDFHHVVTRSRGGKNDAANLLWVCTAAHAWIHGNVKEARFYGLLKRP